MNPRNLTREAIEELNDIEPYCFETDREEQWFNIGLQYGLDVADSDPISLWISVEDYLPKQDEEVIVLCDNLNPAPFYKIAFGHIVDKTICKNYNGWNIPNVVYWFHMPKFPKE